jgi:4-amino-4-deoxy-L-arabinose transferase-like glycosyltransferase
MCVLPGLIGHDPWKQDEAYIFGRVLDMLKDGDWIVVKVGAIPFMEKPPLYHWVAALTAQFFSPWLSLHDAARLASGVFVAAVAGAVALASKLLWGDGSGRMGVLMMLSPLGLLDNAQRMANAPLCAQPLGRSRGGGSVPPRVAHRTLVAFARAFQGVVLG